MTGLLLQIGASKLFVSAVLAGVAWVVQRRVGHPAVTYPLWLLVLVALLLPAVVSIPVLPGETGAAAVISDEAVLVAETEARFPVGVARLEQDEPGVPYQVRITENGKATLAIAWLVVAAVLLGWTLVRTFRFRRWLARTSQPAPPELRREVLEIGRRLDLARLPEVHTTTARVSPMVCWTGGRVRLVIPSFLLASLDRHELRSVLAHELAHVRRRDHLVRWMECLACSAFWWNPVAWWARRELRAAEEAYCDAIGLAAIESTPTTYAESLLRVVELMSTPPTPPAPAFASGAVRGRNPQALERRLRMLISGKSTDQAPQWIRASGTAAAVCLLPLGLVYCGVADQPTPTALEEVPEVAPLTQAEAPTEEEGTGSDPFHWKLLLPTADVPGFTYWVVGTNDDSGPQPLADAPGLPAECQLERSDRGAQIRNLDTWACSSALAEHIQSQEGSEAWAVCVGRGRVSGGWRGHCRSWDPSERYRMRANETGSVLMESINVTGWVLAGPA